ncbi:MAG TPA: hypothetical protein PLT49_03665, partial [Ferruginibacter sp.]|nr:hypothetical protein [Ferruginibacter sp.]
MKYLILSLLLGTMLTATLHAQHIPPPPPLADSVREANIVFTRVEVEAMFPGGQEGWRQFLVKNLRPE